MSTRYYWDAAGKLKSKSNNWLMPALDWLGIGIRGNAATPDESAQIYNNRNGIAVVGADLATYLNTRTGLNLNDRQWEDIVNKYYSTELGKFFGGTTESAIDVASLDADVQEMLDALANYNNEQPLLENYLADARAQIDAENAAEFAEMDRLLEQQQDLYNAELEGLGASYDLARANLLSQQYQQNSQLMDTLQSGMERSRRNALEAGASAGIRIADNINTLLSVQNKQSATAMETANQLSQMMINQRNAEAATRRDYSAYLQADNAQRSNLRLSANDRASSLANTNFTAAKDAYTAKQNEFDEKYKLDNPMYTYRQQLYDANQKAKSKYSGGNE